MTRYCWLVGTVVVVALLVSPMAAHPRAKASPSRSDPLGVVVNEVAWGGTAASSYHEWIELHNNTGLQVDLRGWTLSTSDGSPAIALTGSLEPYGYYLLERSTDCSVSDIPADQPAYTGVLGNIGERLDLRDATGGLVDSADGSAGWPAGSGSPEYRTMERIDPNLPDTRSNWASNDGITRNGLDCEGGPLLGTPRARNSAAVPPGADLSVRKLGPASVLPGEWITYTIAVGNAGPLAAEQVLLTDRLPDQVEFVAQYGAYPFHQPTAGTLVWDIGTLPAVVASAPITFTVIGVVESTAVGALANAVTVTTVTADGDLGDNYDAVSTLIGSQPETPVVLIDALYYHAYGADEVDEAVRLLNISPLAVEIGRWRITDGESTATFPPGTTLAAGETIWCARQATAFAEQFGFPPDREAEDTDPSVPELEGSWPRFANTGDECLLQDEQGQPVDALVYEGGNPAAPGWQGPAVQPWTPTTVFAADGQILYRKRDQRTGLPVVDTNAAGDWAQDPLDRIDGRRVCYPGWDLDAFFFTQRVTETATLTVGVAPDNLFATVAGLLAAAGDHIQIEGYSFRSKELADLLVDRLDHGVDVTLLLEGDPAFEGVTDQERWILDTLRQHGAQVLFMVNDVEARRHDRYKNQHAKFLIVDGQTVLIGSENMGYTGMPADRKDNGTAGRRGVYLITDAPGVVGRAQAIFAVDADPDHHRDVVGCEQVPELCTPAPGFVPEQTPDWMTYTVEFPTPGVWRGTWAFEVVQAPENSLRTRDGLLGLLSRAGPGDTVLVEQLREESHWGPASGTPESDPNPRLAAYLDAARRGAAVRILLDSYLDEDGGNAATAAYLRAVARAEGLDLKVRLGNPSFLGLHNKMVLAQVGGRGTVHVGSLNGNEASAKLNRELALQVQSDPAYEYLKGLFEHDWRTAVPVVYLPLVLAHYVGPQRAGHPLISELYYATRPDREWVEIYNPTHQDVDLSGYKIGDAAQAGDYEGMYQFPAGVRLPPEQLVVVAVTASGFREEFPGRRLDFEMFDSDPTVPDLLIDRAWGTGDWGLRNEGDEVLLLDGSDQTLDVVVYGAGSFPGVGPHPGVPDGHTLERKPAWLDTDHCAVDFRDWPFASPGALP